MNVLIDASAAVKLLLAEEGRERALAIWERADLVFASRLLYPEVVAALSAARRAGRLAERGRRTARGEFEALWRQTQVVELDDGVARAAGELAEWLSLRAGDAVHLASALVLADPNLTLATWDRELAHAASEAGLPVAPPLR